MKETPEDRLGGNEEHFGSENHDRATFKHPSRFGVLTWPEIDFDLKSNMIIKGVIEQDSSALLFGDTGSGKTFLAGDMGIHIAAGRSWFGRKVQRGGVIYIAAEGGLSVRRRVVAFRRHHGISQNENIP